MWQPVLMIDGFVAFVLGAMMFVPAAALKYYSGAFDVVFIQSGAIAMFFGGALFLANYGRIKNISILQGYLITVTCWFLAPLVCSLPFYHNGGISNAADALFEATSGITATGATVFSDVETQPKSVLLWRSMLNALGGIGIVIFAVALMPFLGIGGMHIFKKENSDTEEKFLPKVRYIAKDIILVYISLNVILAVILKYLGMNWFDAANHAMATICTGGFSTKNGSIGAFDNPSIEAVVALFMLLGAMPLTYFVLLFKRRNFSFIISNSQVNTMLKLVFLYIAGVSLYMAAADGVPLATAVRHAGFNIISAITTTGFTSSDFLGWGAWTVAAFFFFMLHGGCTGSTSGSIKIFRWQTVAAFLKKNAVSSLSPNQVSVMKTGSKVIDNDIAASVFVLVTGFCLAIMFFTLLLAFCGVDFMTAIGAVTATITSFGPGLTEATGPVGSYASFTPFVKCMLSLVMVLGRLEVITVLVLFYKIRLPR